MATAYEFPTTRQGIRDLNQPRRAVGSPVNVGETERALSSIGGAMLAGLGISRGGLSGLLLGAFGAALVYRGSTGHCALYEAAGVDTAH
jgi:uncharacterized membrane protein